MKHFFLLIPFTLFAAFAEMAEEHPDFAHFNKAHSMPIEDSVPQESVRTPQQDPRAAQVLQDIHRVGVKRTANIGNPLKKERNSLSSEHEKIIKQATQERITSLKRGKRQWEVQSPPPKKKKHKRKKRNHKMKRTMQRGNHKGNVVIYTPPRR